MKTMERLNKNFDKEYLIEILHRELMYYIIQDWTIEEEIDDNEENIRETVYEFIESYFKS